MDGDALPEGNHDADLRDRAPAPGPSDNYSRELDRLDAEIAYFEEQRRQHRRRRRSPSLALHAARRRIPSFKSMIAVVVVIGLIGYGVLGQRHRSHDSTLAAATRAGRSAVWHADKAAVSAAPSLSHPTPKPATTTTPLDHPAALPTQTGPFQFLATQVASAAPVTYDPCRTIDVVVNNRTLPAGADAVVPSALEELARVTGLQFHLEGATQESPAERREPFQPARYGDRWAPVLIAWSDPNELPPLAGEVAGIGGSQYATLSGGQRVYVSGQVALDGPELTALLHGQDGQAEVRGVVLHELGHLVGLDHVGDPTELMNPEGHAGVTDYGPGDLRGLAQLGTGTCVPSL